DERQYVRGVFFKALWHFLKGSVADDFAPAGKGELFDGDFTARNIAHVNDLPKRSRAPFGQALLRAVHHWAAPGAAANEFAHSGSEHLPGDTAVNSCANVVRFALVVLLGSVNDCAFLHDVACIVCILVSQNLSERL